MDYSSEDACRHALESVGIDLDDVREDFSSTACKKRKTKPKVKSMPEKTKEEIVNALKAFRTSKNWTEKRLAAYVKHSEDTVKAWESGKTRPNDKILRWLFRNRKPEAVPAN